MLFYTDMLGHRHGLGQGNRHGNGHVHMHIQV
jgi:hypothetical protein